MKFVDPRNDVAFKKIFGSENHKHILIAFLNAVLDLHDEREIADVTLLNPYQAPRIEVLKYTLLDVQARDRRGVTFIIEMQVEHTPGFEKRFLYYASKAYVSQIDVASDYPRLNQVIFIGVLDFVAFEGNRYLTRHILLNDHTHRQELQDLIFVFLELPKFTRCEDELDTMLDRWVYFIKHARNLDVIPLGTSNPALHDAYELANKFGWSKEELEVYDYWSLREGDERVRIDAARTEEQHKIARALLARGLDVALVVDTTGLSLDEVERLHQRKE